jgi:signal transduction histidine kinase
MPHLRAFNTRITGWVTQSSWWRLALIALIVLIAVNVVGSILGVDDPVVVDDGKPKDISISVHNDPNKITITPMIGGQPGKPIEVQVPSASSDEDKDDDDSDKDKGEKGERGEHDKSKGIDIDDHGLSFEKDGKRFMIDDHGVHIVTLPPLAPLPPATPATPANPAVAAQTAASSAEGTARDLEANAAKLAANAAALSDKAHRDADALREQKERDAEFRSDVASAISDAKEELQDSISDQIEKEQRGSVKRQKDFAFFGLLKILLTIFLAYLVAVKVSSATKRRADVMVRNASAMAEQESLQRQLLEARLQTMQAQVEPHFLFNTLASVDYLIETDPARASTMQKNLIQYLRAAMPQMRESATQLGREVVLCQAYLEILKVRMEERLQVNIAVPDGLRSADFPPMMLQSMVENAIKHGLEPKAEGGSLSLTAEIVDGDLHVTVADTGLGFSASGASTSGGGVGLSNIRERLQLLYAGRARLEITPNLPSGTRASIVVPYLPVARRPAPAANTSTEEKKA